MLLRARRPFRMAFDVIFLFEPFEIFWEVDNPWLHQHHQSRMRI
jgi:hypothetical protein